MKTTGRSVRWEVSEVALSQAIFGGMQVYIPWLAAVTAPIHDLAMLALAQSVVWPLGIFAQLQLRTLYVVKGQQSLLPLFFRLRLGGCVFLFAATAVSTVLLRSGTLVVHLALALALVKCAELVADILHGECQRAMNASRAARSQTYRCLLFIAAYTIGMVWSGHLLLSLVAGAAAMACWVLAMDLGSGLRWALSRSQGGLAHAGPTLKAGLMLATGLALTSLSVMVGRWAALLAGDTEVLAASALAGTMASLVAMVLGATGQYTLPSAREHFRRGGTAGLRAWASPVSFRLHLAFAGLAAVWACASFALYAFGTLLPEHRLGAAVQLTTIVLAGCFLAGGWLSVLCFTDSTELYLTQRYTALLGAAVVQVIAAAAASLFLYPLFGWIAIGISELVRGLAFLAVVRFSTRGRPRHGTLAPSELP